MEKERYIVIHNLAQLERKCCAKDLNPFDEANKNSQAIQDADEKMAYICSFLIPNDNEYLLKYKELKSDINGLAKHYGVPFNIAVVKSFLLQQFGPINEKPDIKNSLNMLTTQNIFLKRMNEVLVEENAKLLKIISNLEDKLLKDGRIK